MSRTKFLHKNCFFGSRHIESTKKVSHFISLSLSFSFSISLSPCSPLYFLFSCFGFFFVVIFVFALLLLLLLCFFFSSIFCNLFVYFFFLHPHQTDTTFLLLFFFFLIFFRSSLWKIMTSLATLDTTGPTAYPATQLLTVYLTDSNQGVTPNTQSLYNDSWPTNQGSSQGVNTMSSSLLNSVIGQNLTEPWENTLPVNAMVNSRGLSAFNEIWSNGATVSSQQLNTLNQVSRYIYIYICMYIYIYIYIYICMYVCMYVYKHSLFCSLYQQGTWRNLYIPEN